MLALWAYPFWKFSNAVGIKKAEVVGTQKQIPTQSLRGLGIAHDIKETLQESRPPHLQQMLGESGSVGRMVAWLHE